MVYVCADPYLFHATYFKSDCGAGSFPKSCKNILGLWMMASLINGLSYLEPFSFLNTWTNGNQNLCTVYGYPGYVVLGAYLGEKKFTKSQRYVLYSIGDSHVLYLLSSRRYEWIEATDWNIHCLIITLRQLYG